MERRIILVALIENEGNYLLVNQGSGGMHTGLLGFPGGRLEPNETSLSSAIKREVKEELGIDIKVSGLSGVLIENQDKYQLVFFFFKVKPLSLDITTNEEIEKAEWKTVEELKNISEKDVRPPYSWFRKALEIIETSPTTISA